MFDIFFPICLENTLLRVYQQNKQSNQQSYKLINKRLDTLLTLC